MTSATPDPDAFGHAVYDRYRGRSLRPKAADMRSAKLIMNRP